MSMVSWTCPMCDRRRPFYRYFYRTKPQSRFRRHRWCMECAHQARTNGAQSEPRRTTIRQTPGAIGDATEVVVLSDRDGMLRGEPAHESRSGGDQKEPRRSWPCCLRITNRRERPWTFWVEPWGADYTLLPGEACEIVVEGFTEESCFNLSHADNQEDLLVDVEGPCGDWAVYQGDRELGCGHNREHRPEPML